MALSDFPYSFAPRAIIDPTTNQLMLNAVGGQVVDSTTGAPLPMADLNGNPIDEIRGNPFGSSQWFRSTKLAALVMCGSVPVEAVATELFPLAQRFEAVAAAAVAAAAAADQSQQSSAASAAAAQAAAASAAAGGGGGGGGLSTAALDDYLNGTGTASAAGLMMVIPGVRRRQFVNGLRTGDWEPRPNLPVVLNVGYTPAPTDSVSWDVDLTVPAS